MADWRKLNDEYQGEFLWRLIGSEIFHAVEVVEVSSYREEMIIFRKRKI